MCQEITANATQMNGEVPHCQYWTFYKPQMCLILDSCADHEDVNAKSGREDCPPGRYLSSLHLKFIYLLYLHFSYLLYLQSPLISKILVLSCPEKDVSCIPSCGADGSSMDNATSQLQCASELELSMECKTNRYFFTSQSCNFLQMDMYTS